MPSLDANKLYKAAVWYASKKGWPVIAMHTPDGNGGCSCHFGKDCDKPGKHPRYDKVLLKRGPKSATTDLEIIKKWWTLWPDANVGIATGHLSFDVIDVDAGGDDILRNQAALFGGIPDTIEQITGSGGRHIMFRYCGGCLKNYVRFANGLDVRTDDGLIVAPPSVHANGRKYMWEESSKPSQTELAPMPQWMLDWILSTYNASSDNGNRKGVDPLEVFEGIEAGKRDDMLFRYASRLRAQGVSRVEAEVLVLTAADRCKPPFKHSVALEKVESAWKYDGPEDYEDVTYVTNVTNGNNVTDVTRCHQNVTNAVQAKRGVLPEDVRQWLDCTEGVFHYHDLVRDLQLRSNTQIQNLKKLLSRWTTDGILERIGTRAGTYRLVGEDAEEIKWWEASAEEYEIELPLDIHEWCILYPKNIVVVAGMSNAAKTAILLETARLNMYRHTVRYQSSEAEANELFSRLQLWSPVCDLKEWRRVDFRKCPDNFQDYILPNDLNIIDYIELHEDFYRIGGIMRAIHDKLDRGICIVAMQKKPGTEVAKGGYLSLEKPRLYLTVDLVKEPGISVYNICKVIKCKKPRDRDTNFNGMSRRFNVYDGWSIKPLSEWHN